MIVFSFSDHHYTARPVWVWRGPPHYYHNTHNRVKDKCIGKPNIANLSISKVGPQVKLFTKGLMVSNVRYVLLLVSDFWPYLDRRMLPNYQPTSQ